MLLLVLILVVIAFGLLVVALLSGSVLWAWVSVGVSVVAAVVLLVDWLQRRAAVKAGAAPAVEPAAGAPAPLANAPLGLQPGTGRPLSDMDPATEVLPIIPSSRGGEETVVAQAPEQPEARPSDGQQTVVMPAVQPSGSPARPSGADPTVTSSSVNSSPTVTGGDGDRSDPGFGTGDAKAPSGAAPAAGAAAGAVAAGRKADDDAPAEKTPSLEKAPSLDKAPSLEKAPSEKAPSAQNDGRTGDSATEKAENPTTDAGSESPAEPAASGPEASDPAAAATATGDAAGPGTPPASGSDPESTVKVEAHTTSPAGPPPAAAAAAAVDLFGAAPVRQPAEQAAAGQPAVEQPPAEQPPAEQAPAEQAAAAQAPVEDAPEESRDPAAAELVSRLDDEVVVVDEQPRYHVTECRALVAVTVIPLPVREAVELGFTPCGWCSPDRTLAGRHQTASR